MAKRGRPKGEDRRALNLRVRQSLKHGFHVWCAQHERQMTEVVELLLERLLSGAIRVPPKKAKGEDGEPAAPERRRRK